MPWLIGHVFYICPIYNPSRAPCGVTTASRKVDLTSALCSEGPPRYFRQSALCQERTLMRTICGNQRSVGQLDWTNPASVDDPALKLEHVFLPEALIRLATNLDFNNMARCSPKPRNAVGDGDDVLILVASPQANKLVQKKIRVGAAGVPHLHRRN